MGTKLALYFGIIHNEDIYYFVAPFVKYFMNKTCDQGS